MGQFFTSDEVVKLIVGIINPDVKEFILDPFCGSVHFLTSSLEKVNEKYMAEKITEYAFNQFTFFSFARNRKV